MFIYLVFFISLNIFLVYENIPSLLLIIAIFFVFVLVFTHIFIVLLFWSMVFYFSSYKICTYWS